MLGRANSSKKRRLSRDGSNPWKRAPETRSTLKWLDGSELSTGLIICIALIDDPDTDKGEGRG